MAFCNKCGTQVPDGANNCPSCGEAVNAANTENTNTAANFAQNFTNTADTTAQFDPSDIEQNKVLSLFAYLGILFLIPLLACPNSKYARFHANQGIVLFIVGIIAGVASGILAFIPFVGIVISGAISIVLLVFEIMGIVNAVTGKAKELPVIGSFKILK